MQLNFAPRHRMGKWSVGLIVVMPILFYIGTLFVNFYGSVSAGRTILIDIVARPGVALPMLAGFVSGIAAFVCGLLDVTKNKDYSVLVFLSTIAGFFVLLWTLAEIL